MTEYDLLGRPLRRQLDDASSKNAKVAVIVAAAKSMLPEYLIVRSLAEGKEEKVPVEKLRRALDLDSQSLIIAALFIFTIPLGFFSYTNLTTRSGGS